MAVESTETIPHPGEITAHHLDVERLLLSKGVTLPRWALRCMARLLHIDEINYCIYHYRDKEGVAFAKAVLDHLNIRLLMEHTERIPHQGNPIIVGNHPLGGADGLALIAAVGQYRDDIRFPVNDFLMALPGLSAVFIPVDKVKQGSRAISGLEQAFAGDNALLYFPAGLCSRRSKGTICDLQWKPTFVKKAIQYHRDVVPVFFNAHNRHRFYTIANLRQRLGIKFNFEMALLPAELFAQRGKTFQLIVGQPIPWQTFDTSHTPLQWASLLRDYVYTLHQHPDAVFTPQ